MPPRPSLFKRLLNALVLPEPVRQELWKKETPEELADELERLREDLEQGGNAALRAEHALEFIIPANFDMIIEALRSAKD